MNMMSMIARVVRRRWIPAELRTASLLAALLFAASAAAVSAAEIVRLEGRISSPDEIELGTFAAPDAPGASAALHLPCRLDATFSTGERYLCGSVFPAYEILHTFGEAAGAAVVDFAPDGAGARSFFACAMREQAGRLAAFRCDRQPDLPPLRSDDELVSPIEGGVPGLTIANAQPVGADGTVYRSMEPRTGAEYAQLKAFGIATVVILKKEESQAVRSEEDTLQAQGIRAVHIPLDWKDYASFQEPCEQTIEALKILFAAQAQRRKVLFHCTVGEDRTGYLAALFRLLTERQDAKTLFFEEMCERGYDLGDASKPLTPVVVKLRQAVTVLYAQMAERIRRGEISADHLDAGVCRSSIAAPSLDPATLVCGTSTRFRPPTRFSR
jgi:protein-tyrosine phosphatase